MSGDGCFFSAEKNSSSCESSAVKVQLYETWIIVQALVIYEFQASETSSAKLLLVLELLSSEKFNFGR